MSLDAHTLDLEELRYGLSNVTSMRIVDHSDSRTLSYLADWKTRGASDVEIPKTTQEITVRTKHFSKYNYFDIKEFNFIRNFFFLFYF